MCAATAARCGHCGADADAPTSDHAYKCPRAPKCENCEVRTDVPYWRHLYTCPRVPKCAHCNARLDVDSPLHRRSCPDYPSCEKCSQPHALAKKHQPIKLWEPGAPEELKEVEDELARLGVRDSHYDYELTQACGCGGGAEA